MPLWQQILLAVAVPTASGLIVWLTGKSGRENSYVDQLQEDIASLKADRDKDRNRMDVLEARLRRYDDYIHLLRKHIEDGNGPPPPQWPDFTI